MSTTAINSKNIDNTDFADSLSVGDLEIAGSIEIDGNLTVDGESYLTSNVGIDTITPLVSLDINTTDAIALPTGTDAERPGGVDGYIRFNTSLSKFEGYNGAWGDLSSLWSVSGDDIFRISNVGVGITVPTHQLHIFSLDAGTSTPQLKIESVDTDSETTMIFTNEDDEWVMGMAGNNLQNFEISNGPSLGNVQFVIGTDGDIGMGVSPTGDTKLTLHKDSDSGIAEMIFLNAAGTTQDCFIRFKTATSNENFSVGIDANDSSKFKIGNGLTMGSNDRFVIDTSGNISLGTIESGTWEGTAIGPSFLTGGILSGDNVKTSALCVNGEYAKFTTTGLESKSFSEVASDIQDDITMLTGLIGINTSNPSTQLHIFDTNTGTTPLLKMENTGANEDASILFTNDANSFVMGIDGSQFDAFIIADSTVLGSNDRFTINTAGLIGIGTNNPGNLLHVYDTNIGTVPLIHVENTGTNEDAGIRFENDADNWVIGIDGSDGDKFKISDNVALGTNDRFVIDTSGNISLGTIESGTWEGTAIAAGFLSSGIGNGDNVKTSSLCTDTEYARFTSTGLISRSFGEVAGDIQGSITQTSTLTTLTVSGNTTIDTNTLFVNSSTNQVGIGTATIDTDPKLHIFKGNSGATSASTATLTLEHSGANVLQFLTPNTSSGSIFFGDPQDGNSGEITYGHSADQMIFITNSAQRMVIDSGGNVGIDDSTPSYQLDVNGDINTTGVYRIDGIEIGGGSNWTVTGSEIYRLSNVGIQTTNPANELHVYENSTSTTPQLRIENDGTGDAGINFFAGVDWVIGVDNSDSDRFKIDSASTLPSTAHFCIETGGFVGLNINNPSQQLHVNGNILIASTNFLYLNDTNERIGSDGTRLELWAGGSERMTLDGSLGFVGINTNPLNYLHIYENSTSTIPQLRIQNDGTGDTAIHFDSAIDWIMGVDNSDADSFKIDVATVLDTSSYFTIESGGFVGINQNNPSQRLHVNGAILIASTNYLYLNDTNERIRSDGSNVEIWAGGGERLTIEGGGDVGVNTSNPVHRFHVYENSADTSPLLKVQNAASNSDAGIAFQNDVNTYTIGIDGSDSDKFKISDNTLLGTNDRFVIDTSGKVGINTNSADLLLHVFSSSSGGTAHTATNVVFESSGNAGLSILAGTANNSYIFFGDSGNNIIGQIIYRHNGNSLALNSNNAERFRIDSSGDVGIATTNPTFKLHVVGTAGKTTGTAWTSISDERIKRDIVDVDTQVCLDNINSLRIRKFKYKDWYEKCGNFKECDKEYVGFITQELKTTHPNCVRIKDKDTTFRVDYETKFTEEQFDEAKDFHDIYNVEKFSDIHELVNSECIYNESIGAIQCLTKKIEELQNFVLLLEDRIEQLEK